MTGAFLVPGTYTVAGPGGTDVRPVSATIAIPAAATMVSPVNNGSAIRASGMAVNWTGGSGNLQIEVGGCVDGSCNTGAAAVCNVPATAGSFTIPPYVLEALPASNFSGVVLSSFAEGTFTASGLQAASIVAYSNLSGFGLGWGSGSFTLK